MDSPSSSASNADTQPSSIDGSGLGEDLLKKCHNLLDELQEFRSFLAEQNREKEVDIRQFQNSVQSELKSLEKVRKSTPPNFSSRTTLPNLAKTISRQWSPSWYPFGQVAKDLVTNRIHAPNECTNILHSFLTWTPQPNARSTPSAPPISPSTPQSGMPPKPALAS